MRPPFYSHRVISRPVRGPKLRREIQIARRPATDTNLSVNLYAKGKTPKIALSRVSGRVLFGTG